MSCFALTSVKIFYRSIFYTPACVNKKSREVTEAPPCVSRANMFIKLGTGFLSHSGPVKKSSVVLTRSDFSLDCHIKFLSLVSNAINDILMYQLVKTRTHWCVNKGPRSLPGR